MRYLFSTFFLLLVIPFTFVNADDTLSNVEILRFADQAIRASDLEPVPVIKTPFVTYLPSGETVLEVTLTLDNPAPRNATLYYGVSNGVLNDVQRAHVKKGDEEVTISVNANERYFNAYDDDELFSIVLKGDEDIYDAAPEMPIEFIFDNSRAKSSPQVSIAVISQELYVASLRKQLLELQLVLLQLLQNQ